MPQGRIVHRTTLLGVAMVVAAAVGGAACNDDGRELRPARPDQDASVSTLPPPTDAATSLPGFETVATVAEGAVPGAGGVGTVAPTLPGELVAPVLTVTASWRDGGPIDVRHTCDGDDVAPALSWSPAPVGTVEIAISLTDADAPGVGHWLIAGLDPLDTSLGEGVVPEAAILAGNFLGEVGYAGPCPPPGETHTYRYTVHYLGTQTVATDGTPMGELLPLIEGASIASAVVTGTYSRV